MKSILILSANPKNTDKLRLDEEVREIQTGLERALKRDEFEIRTRSALRVSDLSRALLDHNPTIVHFSGHGAGEQGLALENDSGQMQLVSTVALANLFKQFQNQIECVVLNACYSEAQAAAIHQHIDCVIGMNKVIGDRAAIKFAIGFYDALGAGRSYQQGYDLGCSAIALESIPEEMTPVLKIRARSNSPVVVPLPQPESAPTPEKSSQVMTIKGSTVSGQIGQAGGNLAQAQHINQGSSDQQLAVSEVVALLSQLEPLIQSAALLDEQKRKATIHLEAAKEATTEAEPDKNYVATSLKKATEVLKDANASLEASQGLWNKVEPILKQLLPWLGVGIHFFGF